MDPLSEALVLFLGYGRSDHPLSDRGALVSRFGEARAQMLASAAQRLLCDLGAFEVDWSERSLPPDPGQAARAVAVTHPGLSDEAVEALAWKFAYDDR